MGVGGHGLPGREQPFHHQRTGGPKTVTFIRVLLRESGWSGGVGAETSPSDEHRGFQQGKVEHDRGGLLPARVGHHCQRHDHREADRGAETSMPSASTAAILRSFSSTPPPSGYGSMHLTTSGTCVFTAFMLCRTGARQKLRRSVR